MRLLIVRHGHTDALGKKIVQGHRFGRLNEQGQRQAKRLAQRLASETIDAVYSSDLDRAAATTQAILEHHPGLTVVYDAGLRERTSGIYEGQSRQDFIEAQEAAGVPWSAWRPAGGESLEDLFYRVRDWFDGIVGKHPGQTVLVVTHGGVIRSLLTIIFEGRKFRMNLAFRHDNTGLTVVDLSDPSQPAIHALNSISHLDG